MRFNKLAESTMKEHVHFKLSYCTMWASTLCDISFNTSTLISLKYTGWVLNSLKQVRITDSDSATRAPASHGDLRKIRAIWHTPTVAHNCHSPFLWIHLSKLLMFFSHPQVLVHCKRKCICQILEYWLSHLAVKVQMIHTDLAHGMSI